ncbi:hypothetical protein TIFTF001_026198 [Ficus carica]|uniref:Uncharacterized protein n=1 Tax=Ficus carica TaxID=3494 RepID=A0AA88IWK7_FICCA|nr:hypothetical protein TIFTF001_026198 [Ficus carica]
MKSGQSKKKMHHGTNYRRNTPRRSEGSSMRSTIQKQVQTPVLAQAPAQFQVQAQKPGTTQKPATPRPADSKESQPVRFQSEGPSIEEELWFIQWAQDPYDQDPFNPKELRKLNISPPQSTQNEDWEDEQSRQELLRLIDEIEAIEAIYRAKRARANKNPRRQP